MQNKPLRVSLKKLQGDKTERKAFGVWLSNLAQSAEQGKEPLRQRWEQLKGVYQGLPGSSGVQNILKGHQVYPMPLLSPRVRRIEESMVSTITAVSPWVKVVSDTPTNLKFDDLEAGLQSISESSGLRELFRNLARDATLFGVGFLRRAFVRGVGFVDEWINPVNMIVSPLSGATIETCQLVGHRFTRPVREVREDMAKGTYYECSLTSDTEAPTATHENAVDADRDLCTLWEVLVKVSTSETESRWVKVVFVHATQEVLSIEDYPYSRPWYFDFVGVTRFDAYWPETSTAFEALGIQHMYTTFMGLFEAGAMLGALPGGLVAGGSLPEGQRMFEPGTWGEAPGEATVQQVKLGVDLNLILAAMATAEKMADNAMDVSALAIGQEMTGNATATEVGQLAASQQRAENRFTSLFTATLPQVYAFTAEAAQMHLADVKGAYGEKLGEGFYDQLNRDKLPAVRYEVIGANQSESPQAKAFVASQVLALSQQPGSIVKPDAAQKMMLESLGNVDIEAVTYKPEEIQQMQGAESGLPV